jgi:hypothetical protein
VHRQTTRLLWLGFLAIPAWSQQAIINMPSADITEKGRYFMMHETQVRNWNPGRYWYGTNFFCYGVGRNTELAITTYNNGTPRSRDESVGIGFKTAQPLSKEDPHHREQKVTVGSMFIANTRGLGVGHFTYGHYSFKLPTHTRVTMGGFYGTRQLFGSNTGNLLGGIEQHVGKRIVLLTEWFRGQHDFGFVIPGMLVHLPKRQMFVIGYKIPNNIQNGRAGLVLEYGLTF